MFQINCNRHGLFDDCPTIGSRGDMPPQRPLWAESRAKFGDLLDLRGALLSCELFNLPLLIDINQLLRGGIAGMTCVWLRSLNGLDSGWFLEATPCLGRCFQL